MADWLTTWSVWHWLVLGFVLLIAETLYPAYFIVVGLGCDCGAGVMALVPSLSLTALLGPFLCNFSDYSLVALVGNTNIAKIIRINSYNLKSKRSYSC